MDKQTEAWQRQLDLSKRLGSLMGHPEWQLMVDLIEEEQRMHSNKARSVDFRQDPSQYANIVRALDNADAIGALMDKINTIMRLGKEAQGKLDVAAGIAEPQPR